MNEKRQQELDQLNAFIDGELDVDARAAVTARAARDPAYARELAALSQLKATVAESVPVPDIALPQMPPRRFRHFGWAIAASLALLIASGISWTTFNDRSGTSDSFALEMAVDMHRTWVPQLPGNVSNATAHPVSAALNPNVPDLSANGLDLRYVGTRKATGGEDALLVGYLGSRGCRLTMLVNHAEAAPVKNVMNVQSGDVLASLWHAGTLRYTLLAEGMAQARFRLIADSVRRASLQRLPLDQNTRTALSRSRASSPPCRA